MLYTAVLKDEEKGSVPIESTYDSTEKQVQRIFQMCVPRMNSLLQVQTKNNLKMDVPKENNLTMETRTVKLKKVSICSQRSPKRICG